MKKNFIYNKYYRKLRSYFQDMEIWNKFSKLHMQYQFLKIANFLEKLDIKIIEVPFFRFLTMFLDFIRWKIYDFFMLAINGRKFSLYGVTCYCRKATVVEKLLVL